MTERLASGNEIAVILLKTKNTPNDGYEKYFNSTNVCTPVSRNDSSTSASVKLAFTPVFIPVLEHTPNTENLGILESSLRNGRLRDEYGGMIFTSQRAVEGWRDVVGRVERDRLSASESGQESRQTHGALSVPTTNAARLEYTDPTLPLQDSDLTFPLYVVGPATEKAVASIISSSGSQAPSPFTALNPSIHGAHCGSGAVLAPFILHHYNNLHYHRLFTFWEAPRLPFIPLTGPGPSPSKTAEGAVRRGGMVRLERDDIRLRKRKLLFMVGETRRDIIPKTLMDDTLGEDRVVVDEVEVYRTEERKGVRGDIERVVAERTTGESTGRVVVVVVVFSPQGCESMLRGIGFLDDTGKLLEHVRRRWDAGDAGGTRIVLATIGPTTRDFLRERFGFEPDVVAETPSPEGIGEAIQEFLKHKKLIR